MGYVPERRGVAFGTKNYLKFAVWLLHPAAAWWNFTSPLCGCMNMPYFQGGFFYEKRRLYINYFAWILAHSLQWIEKPKNHNFCRDNHIPKYCHRFILYPCKWKSSYFTYIHTFFHWSHSIRSNSRTIFRHDLWHLKFCNTSFRSIFPRICHIFNAWIIYLWYFFVQLPADNLKNFYGKANNKLRHSCFSRFTME